MIRKKELLAKIKKIESFYFPKHRPTLIHVTKTRPISDIEAAYDLGIRDFGENRVDELKEKSEYFTQKGVSDIRWHFIGKLQSNKMNRLLKINNLFAIHSIDSLKLLKSLYERQENLLVDKLLFFVQVNTSQEDEKSGVSNWDELASLANFYSGRDDSRLEWHGLMTMSKLRTDDFEADARFCFSELVSYKDRLATDFDILDLKLSMGMSNDFKMALEYDTDYLRLGSLIYK